MPCENHHKKVPSGLLVVFLIALAGLAPGLSLAQGLNNLWMGGVEGENPQPFGGTDLNFIAGELAVSYINRDIDFSRTSATITNAAGELLFSTNGTYVANATGDTMLNGAGLNPGPYSTQYPNGLHIAQGVLILPKPDHASDYYLFHCTVDDLPTATAHRLYLTEVDMTLDGGLGGVVLKNQVILEDTLTAGKIAAVRHANGRDWWIFCHQANSTLFYRFLVTPQGVSTPMFQEIGVVRVSDAGQVCFSPDGSRFAYYWSETDLDIFDFDRCSGLLSNHVHVPISDGERGGGVAFSPNGQLLYVSSDIDAYQFNLTAADIAGSMVHIAEWDTFYSPFPPFATLFDLAQLAPDGKIYISTANSTKHLHVINDPDVPGMDCNMVQHQLELPSYFANSLPNHPNYHLGALVGSPCDTLGLSVPEHPPPIHLSAYPNPSDGRFTLSYAAQPSAGVLEVRDVSGKLVRQERIPAWSTVHTADMHEQDVGLYQCTIRWGLRSSCARVVLE